MKYDLRWIETGFSPDTILEPEFMVASRYGSKMETYVRMPIGHCCIGRESRHVLAESQFKNAARKREQPGGLRPLQR
jgi:hypothetical protein